MNAARRCCRDVVLLLSFVVAFQPIRAQAVIIDGPSESPLPTLTPRFTVRALGVPITARPLHFAVYVTRNSTGDSPYVDTVTVDSPDSIATVIVNRLLPSGATVYWKARVTLPDGRFFESPIIGPRVVPPWLTLISPNKPLGDGLNTRRPRFVWRSARVDPSFGAWTYEIQILNNDRTEVSGVLQDTTFVPSSDLQANAPYRWQVRASLPGGEAITVNSLARFVISDPGVPTTTLLYKNFPNPFPSPAAFSTCFWFDVGAGGARISLDVIDQRGNLVQPIITGQSFGAGTYGRGTAGSASNCDNRFVWDGRSALGVTVPRGVYLARFTVNGRSQSFVKMLFLGR